VGKDGPLLNLLDANSNPRATLIVLMDGPVLGLSDANGKLIWSAL
jgi:hypothetical protein